MSNSKKKILFISLLMMVMCFAPSKSIWAGQHIPISIPSITVITPFMSSGSFFALNLINTAWYITAIQTQFDPNTLLNDTIKVYKPAFLRVPEIYRYNGDHTKFTQRDRYTPDTYRIYIDADSTGRSVRVKETFYNKEINYAYDIPLDDYLGKRKLDLENQMWDSLATNYDLSAALTGGDLARMISQATGLSIPIPPNPLTNLFGKPEININVSGEVNIRAGWRFDSQNLGTVSAFGQTQSSPVFSQDIRINVTGGIGDKLKIGTDWNTRRQFDAENKFKIGYEGEDDEIIRLIEVGNVSLPNQSSLIGGGQALFGVRADFQFGPLFLKGILSQRRGERKFIDVRGGSSKQPFQIRAYDWAKNHFFLDTAYKSIYREYFKYSTPVIPTSASYYRVKEIEVWESTNEITNTAYGAYAVAFDTIAPKKLKATPPESYNSNLKFTPIKTGEVEKGVFMRLDSTRFRVDYNLGTISIINLRQDRYYAVAYRTEAENPLTELDDNYYGTFAAGVGQKDTLLLKLIYRPNILPSYKTLWARQMKNIYSINATQVSTTDTKIGLWYVNQSNDSTDILPGAPDKLVTILKVDQTNNSTGTPPADGQFDLRAPFFDSQLGEITFPSLEPFREGLVDYFTKQGTPQVALQFTYPQIYDTTYDAARRATDRDRFVISGEVSGRASDRISLGAFNLSPNSVRVILDGQQLREFEDYVIDYYSGTLTLRNPRASLPNANLRIEYEAQDIFNISTRTLVGMRADYQLVKSRRLNANLGFTAMMYDQSAVIDRVRLGDEPVSNSMIGFDAKLNWDAPWLTKLLDALPFYDTKAQSSINFGAEWAYMMPTPNKRTSDIAIDNNEAVVYVDDFEGAQKFISMGLSPFQWQHSSQPKDTLIAPNDTLVSQFRGKTFWWQTFIPRLPVTDPYPNRSTVQGRSNLSPLYVVFNPYERGIYNKNTQFRDSTNPAFRPDSAQAFFDGNKPKIWGGFQRLISSFNTNFDNENIEFIEIMMKLDAYEPGQTKMYVDLGMISEDIIPGQTLNSEDGITKASPIPNGIIDVGEDVGLDAIDDIAEQDPLKIPWPLNLEKDPSKDDYSFDFGKDDYQRTDDDFKNYNNFEGSAKAELGQFPDTEILNKNNGQTITLDNSYFSYQVQLDPNPITNSQIVGGNPDKGWYLYRIPIRKPNIRVGNPSFANIQYLRVWFKGGLAKVTIADWKLVGSHWQRLSNLQGGVSADDSVMAVSFVNVEENSNEPDFYKMPDGVSAPRQLNNPDPNTLIRQNEQSLSINVKNLRYGEERMAVRYFRPLDVFSYKELKFFVHGDGQMPMNLAPGAPAKAMIYIRFGIDSMNYYEYRRPVVMNWQSVAILLSDLTAIKQMKDSNFNRQVFSVPGDPLANFAIRGNPILTRIQYFAFGIANPNNAFPNELTTTIWIDELRLLNPENSSDWAGIATAEIKLADLGSIHTNVSYSQPNFHKLEERFGNRTTTNNWNVSMQGNLEKFAPKSFKELRLPVTYTHSEYVLDPQYEANNDVRLESAAAAAKAKAIVNNATPQEADKIYKDKITRSQSLKIMDSWALTGVRLGIPINNILITETLNKMTLGYSYSQEFERSFLYQNRFNWQWNLNAQYSNTIPNIAQFSLLTWSKEVPLLGTYSDLKLSLLPQTISLGMNMMRGRTTEQSRYLSFPSPVFRNFTAQRIGQFSWKIAEGGLINPIWDYNVSTFSTLVPYELDPAGKQRSGSELASIIFFKDGKMVNWGQNNLHTQTVSLNFKPRLPFGNATRFFEMSGSFVTNYTWNNPLQPNETIRDVAKSAGWNNQIRYGINLRLKALGDDLFGMTDTKTKFIQKPVKDTNAIPPGITKDIAKSIKSILFDWESFKIDITQQNSSINPGVYGNTGFDNFWGGMVGSGHDNSSGPSFAYQMGLTPDPHGTIGFTGSDKFPFFGFETFHGLRPASAVMQDNYSQRTSLDMRTSRSIWEGAILDLNWRTEVGYNKNQTVVTDINGNPIFTNIIAMESFNRSILTIPSVFGMNLFKNSIEDVINLYNVQKNEIINSSRDTVSKNQALNNALAESFVKGMEVFSIFKGAIGRFLPAINWALRWESLEKWGILESIGTRKVSIEHKYTSRYTENALTNDNGRAIQAQIIQHGFQPLIGVTVSFDEKKLKGILTGNVRYSTNNQYQLSSANRATIARQNSDELQIQLSYTLRGFTFTLLDIQLQNDLEFSFLTSYKKNSRATYDVLDFTGEAGRKLDGNTQFKVEPKIRYNISNRVTAAAFLSYEGTFTEGAATPGFSSTQIGLEFKLSIAGGR